MKIEIDATTKEVNIVYETEVIPEGDSIVSHEPSIEEKNRADIDYIAIMTGVEL